MLKPTLGTNDIHIVVDGKVNIEKVFNSKGQMLKEFPCFPHGANGPSQEVTGGDTVAELYLMGIPQWTKKTEDLETVRRPYGWVFIPMDDYEGREASLGRSGIGHHGGGHLADFWDPSQVLVYTHGCVRAANKDVAWLAKLVESAQSKGGKCWMTVNQ